jgi:hypothetical protein
MTRHAGRRPTPWLLALAGYTTLTLIVTWPLALRLSSVVPHDAGDPLLNTWILWWNAYTMPLTERWWSPPMFWPMRGAMALSEHMLGLSLVATPLQWLGAGPVAAYNLLFLLSFPLCALAAHALGYALTGRHDAAAIAGLTFAFNPYRTSQLSHLQILWSFWMPLALMALHRYAGDGRARWLALFAAMWAGEALSNGYFQLFFPLLLVLWVAWFLVSAGDWRRFAAVAVAFCIGSLAVLPLAVPYLRLHRQMGLERRLEEVVLFSADVRSFASAPSLALASTLLPPTGNAEQQLFPGFTAVALVAFAALAAAGRRDDRPASRRRLPLLFAALACVLAAVSLVAWSGRPWALRLGTITLVSVTSAIKPLTAAIWCALLAVAASRPFARALRSRSLLAFYIGAAAAMSVLSLGPEPSFFGARFWYRPPYAWLMELPGFPNVRAPARFAMLAQLCLAAAAAVALVGIRERLPRRLAATVAIVALAGAIADGWIRALPLVGLPERFVSLETSSGGAVAELPVGDIGGDVAAVYRSIYHRRPTVNGYSGFAPVHYRVLRLAIDADGPEAFDGVAIGGPVTVVDASGRVLSIRTGWQTDPLATGRSMPVRAVTAGHVRLDLAPLVDGSESTRWDSGSPQDGTEVLTIDLGLVQGVGGLAMDLGPYIADFPRQLAIELSTDQQSWTAAWTGRCGAIAVAGAVRAARRVPLTFRFPPAAARFIRLRQVGKDERFHWSIANLIVF